MQMGGGYSGPVAMDAAGIACCLGVLKARRRGKFQVVVCSRFTQRVPNDGQLVLIFRVHSIGFFSSTYGLGIAESSLKADTKGV